MRFQAVASFTTPAAYTSPFLGDLDQIAGGADELTSDDLDHLGERLSGSGALDHLEELALVQHHQTGEELAVGAGLLGVMSGLGVADVRPFGLELGDRLEEPLLVLGGFGGGCRSVRPPGVRESGITPRTVLATRQGRCRSPQR